MSFDRPLRGGCHCGRNLYIVQFPKDIDTTTTTQPVQVLFDSHPSHRSTLGPLPSYLRVPLQYYRTLTLPFHADETNAQIHRVYDDHHPHHTTKRHFCGFCGTPLSFWSETPRGEADFIRLALGSLLPEDLGDLEELGFLDSPSSTPSTRSGGGRGAASSPDEDDEDGDEVREDGGGVDMDARGMGMAGTGAGEKQVVVGGAENMGRVGALPWFESLTEGSRLGTTLRRAWGGGTDATGRVRVEWEVVEWNEDDEVGGGGSPRKRKLEEVEGAVEGGRMEGVEQ
ncbi:hypothetical protein C8A01DRAFT_47932 [Parachaetomium inaequale]|uniref:CENP-V/GFA domain-containing protein n=1 Tax=Parachaetomium inaequale TaxID=2588326 RepID=A0AAN6PEC2_9PEZI|nr:hypothetical protein C8A01DRAFT_47932 [Parachaetomium inaequale]